MAKRKSAKKKSKATSTPAKKSVPRAGKKVADKRSRAATKSPVSRPPKEWQGGRIVIKKPPAKAMKGRGAKRVQAEDIRDSRDLPIPKKVCQWFVKKLDAAHKVAVQVGDYYDAPKVPHVSPEAAQLLREKSATWARLADAERDDARAREQESLDLLATIAAPEEFKDGKVLLAKPQKQVAEAHCWKPDFDEEVYQAVLHYYSYLPPDHVGSITDPNGYPAKAMSPEAAQFYRDHRSFWEAKYAESKAQSKSASAARKKAAEASVQKAATSAGLSRDDLEAKLDRLAALVQNGDLQMVADMIAAFGDAWLYEALLAGSSVKPDGSLKPGKILKRFKTRANLIFVLTVAAMPEGLSLDPSLHRNAAMNIDIDCDTLEIVADIGSRLPKLEPRTTGTLDLDDLTSLSDAAAEYLAKHEGNFNLSGLTRLSDAAAESLGKHEGKLFLNGLTNLSDAAAASLAKHKGLLFLCGLTSLSDAAAESLAKREENLYLNDLTNLSDAAAESLAKHKGDLELHGLTRLSDAAAESLAKHEGDLSLRGLTSLSDAAAESLAKREETLDLRGLTSLSDAAAASLAEHKGNLDLSGLTRLSDATAASLAEHKGNLDLSGLTRLSDAAAESLAKHKGELDLHGLTSLSDAAAESLGKHERDLSLRGLTSLSGAAAESLAKREESLDLCGLTSLSDAAAESLAKHEGKLNLKGLTSLSDAAAESLAKHKGNLDLTGLTSLSDAAAESLGKHEEITAKWSIEKKLKAVRRMAQKRATLKRSRLWAVAAKRLTPELKQIQTRLKAKTGVAVKIVVGLLEARNASEDEWSGVFSEQVLDQLIRTGNEVVWKEFLTGVHSRASLLARFKEIAIEKMGHLSGKRWTDFLIKLLTVFPDAAAAYLAKHKGDLELHGLTSLSDAAAASLAKYEKRLYLSDLTSLSDAAAASLAKHKGYLDLNGLSSLSDAAAESLAKHNGDLDLSGLASLSDAAAESLAKHKGDLDLHGLTSLSDAAAESLAKHKGDLDLHGLTSLSDAAAKSLGKHDGYLSLYRLTSLSDAAAKSLGKHL